MSVFHEALKQLQKTRFEFFEQSCSLSVSQLFISVFRTCHAQFLSCKYLHVGREDFVHFVYFRDLQFLEGAILAAKSNTCCNHQFRLRKCGFWAMGIIRLSSNLSLVAKGMKRGSSHQSRLEGSGFVFFSHSGSIDN